MKIKQRNKKTDSAIWGHSYYEYGWVGIFMALAPLLLILGLSDGKFVWSRLFLIVPLWIIGFSISICTVHRYEFYNSYMKKRYLIKKRTKKEDRIYYSEITKLFQSWSPIGYSHLIVHYKTDTDKIKKIALRYFEKVSIRFRDKLRELGYTDFVYESQLND